MNLKEEELLMTKELTPVLLSENSQAIKEYNSALNGKVKMCCDILNRVNNVFALEDGVSNFPNDVNSHILNRYLEKNKLARELNVIKPLSLRDVVLPADLAELKATLEAWESYNQKDAIAYLIQNKDQFSVNTSMVNRECEKFAETQRIYAITQEQIERYHHSCNVLAAIQYEIDRAKIDLNGSTPMANVIRGTMGRQPFTSYLGFPHNKFVPRIEYILKGTLTF